MLQLTDIELYRGEKLLLTNASLTLFEDHKIGIVGHNGCGKSSFFDLLTGKLSPDRGSLQVPKQLRWSMIEQHTPHSEANLIDYVLAGDEELTALQTALDTAEQQNDGLAIAKIHTRLADIEAYGAKARAASLLVDLGFSQTQLTTAVNSLSGGWRMRLNLARVLLSRADILLLDEPTNHLDLEGIFGLQKWLKNYKGTLLLISHDREFLDTVTDQTVFIDQQQFHFYNGNYSSFEKQYAEKLLLQQAAFEKQQKNIAHLQKFVDRFRYKASKAKQAQSRLKALEKIETIAAVQSKSPFHFHFFPADPGANPMLHGRDLTLGYADQVVLKNIRFQLNDGDRIALIGPNGAGKSTFIKLLAQTLTPLSGEIHRNQKIKIGYFAQHQIEQLQLNESPLAHLQALDAKITEQQARYFLGGFYFQGDRVLEPIRHFSGGEKSRLALALLIWQKPNMLLLDEPTNHLDMSMREALSLALQDFSGAVVLVSHDRYLIESTADELWLIANQQVSPFAGNLTDYAAWFEDYQKKQISKTNTSNEKSAKKPANNRAQQEMVERELKKIEAKIEELKKALDKVHITLANPSLFDNSAASQQKIAELTKEASTLEAKIAKLEAEWMKWVE